MATNINVVVPDEVREYAEQRAAQRAAEQRVRVTISDVVREAMLRLMEAEPIRERDEVTV